MQVKAREWARKPLVGEGLSNNKHPKKNPPSEEKTEASRIVPFSPFIKEI